MNPVLIVTHNCRELTKRCVASVLNQDIPVSIYFEDNGSTDGTAQWLLGQFQGTFWSENKGVSFAWNHGLEQLFGKGSGHVLVVNNDAEIAPWTLRKMLSYDVPFVTGLALDAFDIGSPEPPKYDLDPHPDFSLFLVRREAWEKVGPFDEAMKNYASDTDWHVRAHRSRVPLWKALIPYLHFRSSTMRLAPPEEQAELHRQADLDREEFRKKWGCLPGTEEYEALFR